MSENEKAFKHLFGKAHLKKTASAIQSVYPAFARAEYLAVETRLVRLELKARVHLLRDELRRLLPQQYPRALGILLRAIRASRLEGFDLWPVTEFVQTYGLGDLELSLDALREVTQGFTSEWAVRPFVREYPKATLAYLQGCARHPNVHVRRWASEGTRPRLPWGERLQEFVRDPGPVLPILEELKFDDELYVRKSVANHLNDIAKDHPQTVVTLLRRWMREAEAAGSGQVAQIEWTVRRALRTLIKDGHLGALGLLGASKRPEIRAGKLRLDRARVRVGEKLGFAFDFLSTAANSQKLIIDYRIHFVRAGSESGIKVFKWKTLQASPGERVELAKSHSFKLITTRRYYPGIHRIDVQINGEVVAQAQFRVSQAV